MRIRAGRWFVGEITSRSRPYIWETLCKCLLVDRYKMGRVLGKQTGSMKQGIIPASRPDVYLLPILQKMALESCMLSSTDPETQPLRALTRQDPVGLPSSVLYTFIFRKVQKLLFSLLLWLSPIMQSHRSAFCQGKACLDTEECRKGSACRMSFAFLFKMLREKCKCFISAGEFSLPVCPSLSSSGLRRGFLPSTRCDSSASVLGLQADVVFVSSFQWCGSKVIFQTKNYKQCFALNHCVGLFRKFRTCCHTPEKGFIDHPSGL